MNSQAWCICDVGETAVPEVLREKDRIASLDLKSDHGRVIIDIGRCVVLRQGEVGLVCCVHMQPSRTHHTHRQR